MKPQKIIYLLVALLLVFNPAFCQKKEVKILNETKILGKNFINNSDISGVEYLFSEKIHDFFIDTVSNLLTFQLRGTNKGNIVQYDITNKKILWTKKIDYEIHELLKFDDLLILNEYNDGYGLDPYTGATLWTVKNYIYFANPKYKVGVAYFYNEVEGTYSNDLYGINLLKGNPIWKRNISREYGWNDYFYLNDSTLLVVASGLHAININTGNGWDYGTLTGETPNIQGALVGAAVGMAIGAGIGGIIGGLIYAAASTKYEALKTGEHIIRDIVSNTLINNNFIYFASKEQLVKIEKQSGEIIWKFPFPKDLASNSSIFMNEDMVYMINKGCAIKGGIQINYGKPFIAAFDKQTGKQEYLLLLNNENGPIKDFKLMNNEILLLFKNALAKYNIETGTTISEKMFPKKNFGELNYFIANKVFVATQNGYFFSLDQYNLTNVHIFSDQNKILSVDNEMNIINTINYENTGVNNLCYKEYKLIFQENKTLIINNKKQKIAELDVSPSAFILNNILYDNRDKSFIAIDLKQIP